MTAEARVLTRPGPWARVAGLGTIYGKTVRDSRRAALVVGGVAVLFMFGTGAPYGVAPEFSTLELRRQFIAGLTALPLAFRGLLGEPINLETMGGFLSWRVGNFLPVLLGLWPVIALSGTLAGEAAKGSLDLLASTPQSRRTIALEKVAGHVTAVAFAMLILAVGVWGVGQVFGSLPGDGIPFTAGLGQVLLYGLMMLGRQRRFARHYVAAPGHGIWLSAVRELSHLQLRDPVAAHRRSQAALLLHLDGRTSTHGWSHRLGGGGLACRNRRRVAGHRCRRLQSARRWECRQCRLAPAAVAAGGHRRSSHPAARR